MILDKITMSTEQKSNSEEYRKSEPTALLVAYARTFTDIPFSQDIFNEYEKINQAHNGPQMPEELKIPSLAPRFEARYKLINQLLENTGVSQIIEVAAGLSPRGLEMTKDQETIFVELDLAKNNETKKEIVDSLTRKSKSRTNLNIEEGNALDLSTLESAITHLDKLKPIAVITEGLLRYLNTDEKITLAKNIYTLLEQFGGVWITSDTTSSDNPEESDDREKRKTISGDFNLFKDREESENFFRNLGYHLTSHLLSEVEDDLTSPTKLKMNKEELHTLFKGKYVYEMHI